MTIDEMTPAPEAASAADMITRLFSKKSRKIILDAASQYVNRKIYPFIEKQSLIDAEMPEGRPETPTAKEIAAALEYLHSGKGPVYKSRFALPIDDDNTLDDLELECWLENGGAEWESRLVEHQKNYDGFIRGAIYREIIASAKELEPDDNAAQDLIATAVSNPAFEELVEELKRLFSNRMHPTLQESQTSALLPYSKLTRPIKNSGLMDDKVVTALLSIQPTEGDFRLMSMLNEGNERTYKYGYAINQSAAGKKDQVLVRFFVDRKIEAADISLINAIGTYLHNWIKEGHQLPCSISPMNLWRVKEGILLNDTTQKPPRGEIEALCAQIDRLIDTWFYLEYTQEREAGRFRKGSRHAASNGSEGHFLIAKKGIELSSKGKRISVYSFLEIPELYSYCTDKRTVALVPYTDMRIAAGNWKGEYRSLAKEYFLRQIHLMDEGKRKSHKILYKTFYSESGVPSPEERARQKTYKNDDGLKAAIRKNAARDRGHLHDMLNSMIDNGTISGWRETRAKRGNSFDGIEIDPNPDRAVKSKRKEAPKEA